MPFIKCAYRGRWRRDGT